MDRIVQFLTLFSSLGAGLMAGLFFTFSAFMMSVLAKLPSAQGIATMQSINISILTPLFGFIFSGTALACVILAIYSFIKWGGAGMGYLLTGSLLYLIGCVLVTAVFNIPLNDSLAAANPNNAEGVELWNRYVVSWTAWNHVRTFLTLASLASFVLAFRKLF
ncbi:Uncharacterized membrane protein [Paenibacillaceae bacterium GAS479]|nr:Uncharacterized membrane protein [Paenibacillaceae bacterium GAS479]